MPPLSKLLLRFVQGVGEKIQRLRCFSLLLGKTRCRQNCWVVLLFLLRPWQTSSRQSACRYQENVVSVGFCFLDSVTCFSRSSVAFEIFCKEIYEDTLHYFRYWEPKQYKCRGLSGPPPPQLKLMSSQKWISFSPYQPARLSVPFNRIIFC